MSAIMYSWYHLYAIQSPSLDSDRQTTTSWLGANDLTTEGEFRWVEDGSPVQSADWQWQDGEPNGGAGENCVLLYAQPGRWADLTCAHALPFWCQRQAGGRLTFGKAVGIVQTRPALYLLSMCTILPRLIPLLELFSLPPFKGGVIRGGNYYFKLSAGGENSVLSPPWGILYTRFDQN